MTNYRLFVDGQPTGYSVMAPTAADAVATVLDDWGFWMDHLSRFKLYGKPGIITAKGPVRFPDGDCEVAHG